MRIIVDMTLCEANGMCEVVLPEVFVITEEDTLEVRHDQVNKAKLDALEQAIRSCPRRALRLSDD